MRLPALIGVLSLALVESCGDPFTQPACYYGPGCGEDAVKPVGEIIAPRLDTTVRGPFWLRVGATDNIAVFGVSYLLMDIAVDQRVDVKPPYEFLVNPGAADSPNSLPGPRYITIFVRDVAENVDTLELTVDYQF